MRESLLKFVGNFINYVAEKHLDILTLTEVLVISLKNCLLNANKVSKLYENYTFIFSNKTSVIRITKKKKRKK